MDPTIHYNYWLKRDVIELASADTVVKQFAIAMRVVSRIDRPIHMVSGPISTGGVGSIRGNIFVFERIIEMLWRDEKLAIFSQMPFEEGMVRIHEEWQVSNPGSYCMPILDEFYLPLFKSGAIVKLHFINGWESSFGARWEREQCERLGISCRDLPVESDHALGMSPASS